MSEPAVVVETEIKASPDELYTMVSDLPRMGEWSPENDGATWKGGADGPEVGARFKGKNRNGWRRWSTAGVVTEAEPGRAFAFDVSAAGLKVATWRYTFEASAAGTRVVEEWYDPRSGLMKKLGLVASGVADRATHNRATMEKTLAALKAAAEG